MQLFFQSKVTLDDVECKLILPKVGAGSSDPLCWASQQVMRSVRSLGYICGSRSVPLPASPCVRMSKSGWQIHMEDVRSLRQLDLVACSHSGHVIDCPHLPDFTGGATAASFPALIYVLIASEPDSSPLRRDSTIVSRSLYRTTSSPTFCLIKIPTLLPE